MALESWLFVRGGSSVMVQVIDPLHLLVRGPRHKRVEHAFASEDDLVAAAQNLEEELLRSGWQPLGFNHDRRSTKVRRLVPRSPEDRRRS